MKRRTKEVIWKENKKEEGKERKKKEKRKEQENLILEKNLATHRIQVHFH